MGYQALLFCPDEKTARTLTQVLSELEFNVEPCTETFAAVKKLMGEHFDAVVVDCDNEQNATLLFKSARNSTSNQASLAVAVVEGQAGVAKAFRIGANLVLTKPINVEQSKGTLRVARGLLRKGEAGKAVTPVATTPNPPSRPAASPAKPAQPITAPRPNAAPVANPASFAAAPAPTIPAPAAKKIAASAAPAASAPPATIPAIPTPATPAISAEVKPPSALAASTPPALWAGSGAASAPAPAREVQPALPAEEPVVPTISDKEIAVAPADSESPYAGSAENSLAPSFSFGGANAPEESTGSKKILLGIVAVVLVGALAYVAWSHFSDHSAQPVNQLAVPASSPNTQPAPASSAPAASLSKPSAQGTSAPATSTAAPPAPQEIELTSSANEERTASPSTAKENATTSKSALEAQPGDAPRVVKGGAVPKLKAQATTPDAPAPSLIGLDAAAVSAPPPNLGGSTAPKPVLQRVKISEGVSMGLLVKKVDPVYPPTALHMRVEGAVQLLATISKTGNITEVKVLKGEPQLSKAASDAVKHWKYQPYLLNGEPVEIQTQITVNFRLPH